MTPLVSVLLPTRNRLEFLAQAIQTVLAQDDQDFEIVVSDNCSEEDVAGHIASLGDSRIRYLRCDEFVPVTTNWNHALAASSGDYVVMLGDDDGLAPGFVSAVRSHRERFGSPEVIYTSAWQLAYPDVMPDQPDGFRMDYGYAQFMQGHEQPFLLSPAAARKAVQQAMRFRVTYGFNMQFATISRALIERLAGSGPFFQSPFPDYYAMNVALMTATSVVVDPRKLVIIGVTPRSYGFFHVNEREDEGKQFLGQEADPRTATILQRTLLPGSNINAGWLAAVETIAARYPEQIPCAPARKRFRMLQILDVLGGRQRGVVGDRQERELLERLTLFEKGCALSWKAGASLSRKLLPARLRTAFAYVGNRFLVRQFVDWRPPKQTGGRLTMLDFYEELGRLEKTTV